MIRTAPGRLCGVVVTALGLTAPALAAEAPPVLVVRERSSDAVMAEVANRTQAELSASGFGAAMHDCERAALDCLSSVAARGAPRIAAVATFRDGEQIATEVRISGGARAAVARRVSVQQSSAGDEAPVLAIRAVELVRATLLQADSLDAASAAARGAVAPAADTERASGPPPEITAAVGWSIGGGGAVLESAHGFSAAYALLLRAGYRGAAGFSGSLVVAGPGFTFDQPSSSGPLRIRQELVALELGYAFARSRAVQPRITLGVGAHYIEARPNDGSTVENASAFTLLAAGGVGALVILGKYVALFFDAQAIFTEPNADDLVRGATSSRLGSPSLLMSLGVQRTF